jgi:hypothetical protein
MQGTLSSCPSGRNSIHGLQVSSEYSSKVFSGCNCCTSGVDFQFIQFNSQLRAGVNKT